MKKPLIQALKLVIAAVLIYWLIATKKITAEPFIQLWGIPWLTFFVFAVIGVMIFVNNYRWVLLLRGQGIQANTKQTLPLTFICLFFNLAMPGAVGGDFLRAYYIAREKVKAKVGAATSVLVDRVVGLYAMALIALFAVLTHLTTIMGRGQLQALALFIIALVAGFTVFFFLSFSKGIRQHPMTKKFLDKMPGGSIIEQIYDAVHAYRNGKREFIFGILLSILVQTANIFSFYVIAVNLHYDHVTLGALLFVVPLGFIAMAIPISPGGIGVGQAAFMALLGWYGGGASDNLGPTLITIYQVVQAVWGLVGVPLYFMRKAPVVPEAVPAK